MICGLMKSQNAPPRFNDSHLPVDFGTAWTPPFTGEISALEYDWHEETSLFWAESGKGCDWKGNDMDAKMIPATQCGPECERTPGCTHFTWTWENGGTCYLKKNPVTKDQVIQINKYTVCGIMKSTMDGAPMTDAPKTDAPVTKAPVTDAPVTDGPVKSGDSEIQVKTINGHFMPAFVDTLGHLFVFENGHWNLIRAKPKEKKSIETDYDKK